MRTALLRLASCILAIAAVLLGAILVSLCADDLAAKLVVLGLEVGGVAAGFGLAAAARRSMLAAMLTVSGCI